MARLTVLVGASALTRRSKVEHGGFRIASDMHAALLQRVEGIFEGRVNSTECTLRAVQSLEAYEV